MLNEHAIIAFSATLDAERARRFYGETLGLRLVADEPWSLVFDAHGTMLRVQRVKALTPPQHTVVGWQVPDIGATVRALAARGVEFLKIGFPDQDDQGIWSSPSGAKVAWFKDPDGNILSLTQF
jgi:catechol 2,3-dioxygenase-like lactoylglutathione lyase family enzyme